MILIICIIIFALLFGFFLGFIHGSDKTREILGKSFMEIMNKRRSELLNETSIN